MARVSAAAAISPPSNVEQVYEFYDEPVLFTARGSDGQLYLCMLVGVQDIQRTWLYVPLSQARLAEIEANRVDLRSAFSEPEGDELLLIGTTSRDGDSWRRVRATELPDDVFTKPGLFLDL